MASTYSTVKYGSKGGDVTALQNALNAAGYGLTVDGIFGKNTLAAVKSYQQAKGLAVDGIVGANTWGALNSASAGGSSSGGASATGGQSQALQDLISQLQQQTYTPKTDEEMRQQAEGEYQSYYDQLRLAAQQQKESTDLALQQQREGLQASYDKQREQSEKAYGDAYSTAGREQLERGMARSSYGAQTLANIDTQGAEAQQAISEQQTAAEGNIDAQRTQLASQLAAQISQYSASQAADVLNRMRELEDQEYDRSTAAQQYNNSLAQQIYQMIYQEQRDSIEDQQWQQEFAENTRQFNASLAKSGSSGGSRSSSSSSSSSSPSGSQQPSGMSWNDFVSSLSGGSSSSSSGASSVVDAVKKVASTIGGVIGVGKVIGTVAEAAKKKTTTTTKKSTGGTGLGVKQNMVR